MGRARGLSRWIIALTCALALTPAVAQDLGDDTDDRMLTAVFDLTADDADTRAKAIETLSSLAPGSLSPLLSGLPNPAQHAGWAAALAVARRAGPERVLREVEATQSSRGAAREPVVARYLREVRELWTESPVVTLATTDAILPDPARLPPGAALPIGEALPSELAWGEYPARLSTQGALQVATSDRESFDLKVPRGGWVAVKLGSKRWPRHLMIFDRGGRWYVASAAMRVARARGVSLELLDVDGDGEYAGANDLVALDGGAFLRIGATPHVWAFGVRCVFNIRRADDSVEVDLWPLPIPEGPGRNVPAWEWVNTWRAQVGLPPQALDRPRSNACKEHHDYWSLNGFSAHGQDPNKPGASPTGAKAGRSSSVWEEGDPLRLAAAISRNILHRRSLIAQSDEGLGLAGGAAGSLLWGGQLDSREARTPLVIPGPGQRGVPTEVLAELPEPKDLPNFYGRGRGYPVAVHFGGVRGALSDVSLTLETAEGGKAVAGTLFSPARPYHPNYDANEAVFVADSVLKAKTWYLARFGACDDEGEFEVAWWFATGDAPFPKRTGRR